MTIADYLKALWKTFTVAATGAVVLWLANRGIHLPAGWNGFLESLLLGAGLAAYNTIVNYLQSRTGENLWDKLCRLVGRILTLGVLAPPVYPGTATLVRRKDQARNA